MTVALKLNSFTISKSNQSLGGDDYFFALCISFPIKYPAPTQTVMRESKKSNEIVIISIFLLSDTAAQFTIYNDWACTPRRRATILPYLVAPSHLYYRLYDCNSQVKNHHILKIFPNVLNKHTKQRNCQAEI